MEAPVLLVIKCLPGMYMAEGIFDGLREAQGLGRAAVAALR
jgi:hypothetical protein